MEGTMHVAKVERAAHEIKPRPMEFEFSPTMPYEWVEGDPFTTQLMNALSLTFPEGERFFVASVRAMREAVRDPVLAEQVRGFLAQEGHHRREHHAFNEWLRTQGVDVDGFYAEITRLLDRPGRRGTRLSRLAATCALEHFTAIMAHMLLSDPKLSESAHPAARALWMWHAIEELEHKSVAFDVYRANGGTYPLRVFVMLGVTFGFITQVGSMHVRLLRRSGHLGDVPMLLRGLVLYWGPGGRFARLIPAYLRYFSPRFHPSETDESALMARYERELQGAVAT
jgi:hypothetical protein